MHWKYLIARGPEHIRWFHQGTTGHLSPNNDQDSLHVNSSKQDIFLIFSFSQKSQVNITVTELGNCSRSQLFQNQMGVLCWAQNSWAALVSSKIHYCLGVVCIPTSAGEGSTGPSWQFPLVARTNAAWIVLGRGIRSRGYSASPEVCHTHTKQLEWHS